jgi:hypothetical protein
MPGGGRTPDDIRRELEGERSQLVTAVADLRVAVDETAAKVKAVKAKVPLVAAGVTTAGLGLGAAIRLITGRRHDEPGTQRFRVGRWSIHEHD